jgi:hypothetical protein
MWSTSNEVPIAGGNTAVRKSGTNNAILETQAIYLTQPVFVHATDLSNQEVQFQMQVHNSAGPEIYTNFPYKISVDIPTGTATDGSCSNVNTTITYKNSLGNFVSLDTDNTLMAQKQVSLKTEKLFTDASGLIIFKVKPNYHLKNANLINYPAVQLSATGPTNNRVSIPCYMTRVCLTYNDSDASYAKIIDVLYSTSLPDPPVPPAIYSTTWKSDRFDLNYSIDQIVNGQTYKLKAGSSFVNVVNSSNPVTAVAVGKQLSFNNASYSGLTQGAIQFQIVDSLNANVDSAFTQVWNVVCFLRGSKILVLNEESGKEEYVPIQNIRKGDKVKTLKNGFVKVDSIGTSILANPGHGRRTKSRLYKLSKKNYPELKEDLYLTGCHSILVDDLTPEEKEKVIEQFKYTYVTDRKYRLAACIDERAVPFEEEGDFEIWHLALEHDDYYMNYGIYANGLLVETASKRMMNELSNMVLL